MSFDSVHVPSDGGVKGVWKSISEDLRQIWIFHMIVNIFYDLLHSRRSEGPTEGRGPLIRESQWAFAEWMAVLCQRATLLCQLDFNILFGP